MELSSDGFARYDKCCTKAVLGGSLICKDYCFFQIPEENGITIFKLLNKQAPHQIGNSSLLTDACDSFFLSFLMLVILFLLLKSRLRNKDRNWWSVLSEVILKYADFFLRISRVTCLEKNCPYFMKEWRLRNYVIFLVLQKQFYRNETSVSSVNIF